jgi:hypothetical protein
MERASAAAQENFACAKAVMAEGYAFDVPRRAAQERSQVFRMDFPHSMRPSIDPEFPGPEGTRRGALGAANLRRKRSGRGSAAAYTFDTYSYPNRSERG